MEHLLGRVASRIRGDGVPEWDEGERFGAQGEDAIYRILREHFECVIRGAVIPHKDKYLEKDFLILHKGACAVIEVKNWKGEIGQDLATGDFYQNKPNGVQKRIKSPVGTTQQFLQCMKKFYRLKNTPVGAVIFADPDCKLSLPESMENILLIPATRALQKLHTALRKAPKEDPPLSPHHVLRCARIYSEEREFCKALISDEFLPCFDENGAQVRLSVEYLRHIVIEHQPMRLRDKLSVTFVNGSRGVFYNHNASISLCCLDGSCRRMAIHKIQYILF